MPVPVEVPLHVPLTTKSGRTDGASYYNRQPGQQLDEPVGEASNASMKMGGKSQLEARSRSIPYVIRPRCGGIVSQKGRPAEREVRREAEVDDRKEGTIEKMEEQQGFF
jgi:hypothetical protein